MLNSSAQRHPSLATANEKPQSQADCPVTKRAATTGLLSWPELRDQRRAPKLITLT